MGNTSENSVLPNTSTHSAAPIPAAGMTPAPAPAPDFGIASPPRARADGMAKQAAARRTLARSAVMDVPSRSPASFPLPAPVPAPVLAPAPAPPRTNSQTDAVAAREAERQAETRRREEQARKAAPQPGADGPMHLSSIDGAPPEAWTDEDQTDPRREANALAGITDFSEYADRVRQGMSDGGMRAVHEFREIARLHREAVGPEGQADADRLDAMIDRLAMQEVLRGVPGADLGVYDAGNPQPGAESAAQGNVNAYVPPMDAATQGTIAQTRREYRVEQANAANFEDGAEYYAALEERDGIKVTRAPGGDVSFDFGGDTELTGIPAHEASRLAANMARDPAVADAMADFAEGTVDLEAIEDRLDELYALPDQGAARRKAARDEEPHMTAELRAERARLETLYLAESLRREGAPPQDIRAALVAGYGPDPNADIKMLTTFALNIAPGTSTAMALIDAGVALGDLKDAASRGNYQGMADAGLGTALAMAGLIPGVKAARGASARVLLGDGRLTSRVRDSVLDAVARRRYGEGGKWTSRMEIAAAERQFVLGGDGVVSARTMIGDEAWDALDAHTRGSLRGAFNQIKGDVGETVASRLLARSGFSRRTGKGDNRYLVWREDLGGESLRLHDDVTEERAQSILGLAVRPVRSVDGGTTNWEIKVDDALKGSKQVEDDARVVDPDSVSRSGLLRGPSNPPVAEVRNMRILTNQFPEGELVTRMEQGLRGKYDDAVVDQVLEGLRIYDQASRRSGSGVAPMDIGEVMVVVISALERSAPTE